MHHCARIFCEVGLEFHLATMHDDSDDIHTHNIAQLATVIMLSFIVANIRHTHLQHLPLSLAYIGNSYYGLLHLC